MKKLIIFAAVFVALRIAASASELPEGVQPTVLILHYKYGIPRAIQPDILYFCGETFPGIPEKYTVSQKQIDAFFEAAVINRIKRSDFMRLVQILEKAPRWESSPYTCEVWYSDLTIQSFCMDPEKLPSIIKAIRDLDLAADVGAADLINDWPSWSDIVNKRIFSRGTIEGQPNGPTNKFFHK